MVLKNLEEALEIIKKSPGFSNLIPEVGCNIAMAIPDASSILDVAAVSGRIVRLKNEPHAVGCVCIRCKQPYSQDRIDRDAL